MGKVTPAESDQLCRVYSNALGMGIRYAIVHCADDLLTNRRSPLTAKAVPTLEEEVLAILQSNTCTTADLAKQIAALIQSRSEPKP